MKRISFHAMAFCLMAILGLSSAWAENYSHTADCQGGTTCAADDDCDDCLDDCCCGGGGFVFDAEMLLWKYNRTDGTRVGTEGGPLGRGEHVNGNYNGAPRLTFGWIGDDGLGVRARWFEYTHDQLANEGAPSRLNVDTYSFDLEVFEKVSLNECWSFELSGGLRYNEFDETMRDGDEFRRNSFSGAGGVVGLQANRVAGNGQLYGRFRNAILMDDRYVQNTDFGAVPVQQDMILPEAVVGMTEISTGYEWTRNLSSGALLTLRAGYEWQMWHNYSSAFAGPISPIAGAVSGEAIFGGSSDVGFNGLTFSAGVEY